MPQVEREEFLNVGVIAYCRQQKFLQVMCTGWMKQGFGLSDKVDMEELKIISALLKRSTKVVLIALSASWIAFPFPLAYCHHQHYRANIPRASGLCEDAQETLALIVSATGAVIHNCPNGAAASWCFGFRRSAFSRCRRAFFLSFSR